VTLLPTELLISPAKLPISEIYGEKQILPSRRCCKQQVSYWV